MLLAQLLPEDQPPMVVLLFAAGAPLGTPNMAGVFTWKGSDCCDQLTAMDVDGIGHDQRKGTWFRAPSLAAPLCSPTKHRTQRSMIRMILEVDVNKRGTLLSTGLRHLSFFKFVTILGILAFLKPYLP